MPQGVGKTIVSWLLGLFAMGLGISMALFVLALARLGLDHIYTASALSSVLFCTSTTVALWAINYPTFGDITRLWNYLDGSR